MFSFLRIALVVGVIFYLSPVRQQGDLLDTVLGWVGIGARAPASGEARIPQASAAKLQGLWNALPDSAKTAVIEQVLSKAAGEYTLKPDDRAPAWKGHQDHQKPRG
jgi:hypothetical protein